MDTITLNDSPTRHMERRTRCGVIGGLRQRRSKCSAGADGAAFAACVGAGDAHAVRSGRGRRCGPRRADALVENCPRLAPGRGAGVHMALPRCCEPVHRPATQTARRAARSDRRTGGSAAWCRGADAGYRPLACPLRCACAIARPAGASGVAASPPRYGQPRDC